MARVVPSRDRIQQKKKRVAESETQECEVTTVGALLEAEDTAFSSEDESCFVSESFSQQVVDHSLSGVIKNTFVADPDPGSGAFLPRDPGWVKNQDPGPG